MCSIFGTNTIKATTINRRLRRRKKSDQMGRFDSEAIGILGTEPEKAYAILLNKSHLEGSTI